MSQQKITVTDSKGKSRKFTAARTTGVDLEVGQPIWIPVVEKKGKKR